MGKYPRTPHLPYSPGVSNDDRIISSVDHLLGRRLVLTQKMDGSNVCLERENVYARSHSAAPNHPSFDALKAFHSTVKNSIDPGLQLFGEWLYAKHSISYKNLPSYLMVFGIRYKEIWLSWEDVKVISELIDIPTVPVFEINSYSTDAELKDVVEKCFNYESDYGEVEGVVVKLAEQFNDHDFSNSIAKYVRANHVQTTDHWKNQKIIKNEVM